MPQNLKNKINSVRYYNCGYCENQMAFVYRKHPFEKRKFPSGVFLLKHPTEGYTLFDTGYSMSLNDCGFRGWLYQRLNPTYIRKEDEISHQLVMDGVDPAEVRYVVLSHLHPDHIGGVKFFPQAKIIVSRGSYETYMNAAFSDLVFHSLLPDWFEDNLIVLDDTQLQSANESSVRGFDIFNDGSLLLTMLDGHTDGHLGAYVPGRLLLAGDACWGEDLLTYSRNMRAITKLINHDSKAFNKTLDLLTELQGKGVRLCFSHDTYDQVELLS